MKYPLLVAAIGLSLVACSEKQPEKAAPQVATPAPIYVKATTVRPAAIQSTVSLPGACAFDGVNDQPGKDVSISDKARVKLIGWAGNVAAGTSPQQVIVELEGPSKVYAKAVHGIKRPDVAAFFNKPGLADTGWVAYADLSEMAAGAYKVRIIQVEGQSGLVCDSNNSIVIK
ncbi:MAG: hypothetical protein A3G80_08950 [Betaproteobacteria bacterium RIFCSPLOWO2_12_FULL_62_13b]|nr:MAG: hypothetical protein A3G80_08950 [Betaproteobacteria bacterium RIFCSPLOWO2_12_FULL_62_13b]